MTNMESAVKVEGKERGASLGHSYLPTSESSDKSMARSTRSTYPLTSDHISGLFARD